MFPKVKVHVQRRGLKNFKTIFAIAMMECGETKIVGPMNLGGTAQFLFRFTMDTANNCRLQTSITFKKHEKIKDNLVDVQLTQGDLIKRCQVPDEWLEYINMGCIETNKNSINCSVRVCHNFLHIVEVDITMHFVLNRPLSVYKKLSADTTFTDFNLKTGNGSVAVHRAMLAMHSDVFLAMLNGEWKETSEGIISLNGVSLQTLQHLKDFMYLRTLPEDVQHLQQLLLIAQCYMVQALKTACICKLVEMVTPENFDTLVEFACQHNVPDLIKVFVTDIPDNTVLGIHKMKLIKLTNKPVLNEPGKL